VISAAHCLTGLSLKQALLYIGCHDLKNMSDTDFQKRVAEQLIIHPDYYRPNKAFSDADIGLIIFSLPVVYTDFIKPICLWPADEAYRDIVTQKGVVAGWNYDSSEQEAATPKAIEMPVVSTLTCVYDDISYLKITSKRTLCVGEKNGKGPCHGDSGSGFVMKMDGKWVLRGIVSAGLTNPVTLTCDKNKYAVLSDTAKFMKWISFYMNFL
jgi:Trypsin